MKYTLRAEVEYEDREELVDYVTQQVSQMLMATTKVGMDPFGMFAEEPSEAWCYDWARIIRECGDVVGVRGIVERYSTEKLEEIANLGFSVAANGMVQRPEAQRDFAVVLMSSITKAITGTNPIDDEEEEGASEIHKAFAAYMNEVAKGCDGFTGEDFELVSPRVGGRPPIILSAKVDVTELDGWTNFLEGVFDGSDTWNEFCSDGVGVYGGIAPSQLRNVNFAIYSVDDTDSPVGVADTVEHAQVVRDWFAAKGEETLVIDLGRMG